MRILISFISFCTIAAFAATAAKSVEEVIAKSKPPIIIPDEKGIAEINPDTLVVTYHKGADPKVVVNQLVKAWSTATQALSACQVELEKAKDKKK
jgi:hypothetical protein